MSKLMFRSRKRNSYGFALMEVMVAAGILGVISLGVVKTIDMTQKSSKKLATDMQINEVWNNILQIMRKQDSCTYTLSGLPTAGTTANQESEGDIAVNTKPAAPSLVAIYKALENGAGVLVHQRTIAKETKDANRVKSPVNGSGFDTAPYLHGSGTQGRTYIKSIFLVPGSYQVNTLGTGGTITLQVDFQNLVDITNVPPDMGKVYSRQLTVNVMAAAGAITECSADKKDFNAAFCDTLGGRYDEVSNTCRDLNIQDSDGTTLPAGDADSTSLQTTLDIVVGQDISVARSARINVEPATATFPAAAGNLHVGNDALVSRGFGVGVLTPPSVAGDAVINNNLKVGKSLGIGVNAPDIAGQARINVSLGVGVTPPTSSGMAKINSKLGVGSFSGNPSHQLDVRGQIRNTQSTSYDVWLQGGSATTSGTSRNLALLGHRSLDKLYVNYNGEYSGGVHLGTNSSGVSITNAGAVIIGETQSDYGALPSNHAATAGWVRDLLSSMTLAEMSTAERQAIINHLITSINSTNAGNGVDLVIDNALSKVSGAANCNDTNQVLLGFNYNSSSNTLSPICGSDNTISDTKCNIDGGSQCSTVYGYNVDADYQVRARRFYTDSTASGYGYCLSNGWGCRTTRRVYPYACTTRGLTTICPYGYFSAGRNSLHRICCAAKIR